MVIFDFCVGLREYIGRYFWSLDSTMATRITCLPLKICRQMAGFGCFKATLKRIAYGHGWRAHCSQRPCLKKVN